ncbi:hypothetical protein [Rhizobium phage RHph_X2_26]|nr:hypothetical protein [Rhizobium phage RHph_X2_26]
MVDVPEWVENESAYIAAAIARIKANAAKGKARKMAARMQAEPDFARLIAYVHRKAEKGAKFFVSMVEAIETYGALSEGQEATCRRIMEQDAARLAEVRQRDADSEFVGEVGKRELFAVDIVGVATLASMYGDQYLHFMKDPAGNVLVYKGSAKLGEKGAAVRFKATIKQHNERDGIKQTVVSRPVKID